MEKLKKYKVTLLIILVVFFTRILLFNKDAAFFWADERHFEQLITKLQESKEKNNYMIAVNTIFHLNARPGLGLFYYPAAFFQWKNPNIPFGSYFNVVINSSILILIYFIVKKTYGLRSAILSFSLLLFSSSTAIYLRHLLPYDISLLVLLSGLLIYVNQQRAFIFGLLAGLSFLTYASYYYILPIPLILFLYHKSLKPALIFLLGIAAIFIFTNLMYISIDSSSYFGSLKAESGGVTSVHIGDYVSAFSFIGQYIFVVDGIWNAFLILIASILYIFQWKGKKFNIIAIYLLLTFLIMEITSHVLKMHVLYGRTVRPLYLLLLVFASIVLDRIFEKISKGNKKVYFRYFLLVISITFLIWLPNFLTFKDLIYPEQFKKLAKEYLQTKSNEQLKIKEVLFVNYFGIGSPPKMNIFKEYKGAEPGTYYIVNANVIYPYYGSYNMDLFCKSETLLSQLHVQSKFKPYLFEGWGEAMRRQITKEPLYYQLIYCK